MPSSRTVAVNGLDMFIRENGTGPLVLLCHGWPELSYSWRHQLTALADAGFQVVAPDMRGFGRTSAPAEIEAYTIFHLVGDMVALVTALGERQAIIIGHDWGARSPGMPPCSGPTSSPRSPACPSRRPGAAAAGRSRRCGTKASTNFYWQYFQPPGAAEREFERDVNFTMHAVFSKGFSSATMSQFLQPGFGFLGDPAIPRPLPPWLSEADLIHFVDSYRLSGFRGGLNWYRNIDRNWDLTAPWQGAQIRQPSLFIAGGNDEVVTGLIGGKRIKDMEKVLPDLRGKLIIDGAGHWIQQERPDEVNAALIAFLKEVR